MPNEYIEIIHVNPLILRNERKKSNNPKRKATIDRILKLCETTPVHYHMDEHSKEFPDIPKNTPIRLGGGMWEWCVKWRADALEKNGYTNVTPDRLISISLEESEVV